MFYGCKPYSAAWLLSSGKKYCRIIIKQLLTKTYISFNYERKNHIQG